MSRDPDAVYQLALESIDRRAKTLLETVRADDGLEPDVARTATRHLREIRAEVDRSRLELLGVDHRSPALEEAIPVVVRRGSLSTTVLGPDPSAYERVHGRESADRSEEPEGGEGDV